MKIKFLSSLAFILLFIASSANAFCFNRPAVQAAIASGGVFSIGAVDYTDITEVGITVSGKYTTNRYSTRTVTPVIFAGLRNCICNNTYFAYGINTAWTFGKVNGWNIQRDYSVAPYISLEYMLTHNLMLTGWIEPYNYHYTKRCWSSSTATHSFFATGGIGFNYLFC